MQTLVRTCVQADPVELDNGDVSAPSRFTGKTQVVEWDFATEEAGKTGQVSVLMLLDNYLLNNPLCLLILDTFSSYSSFFCLHDKISSYLLFAVQFSHLPIPDNVICISGEQ